jgi:hypothetical protein
MNFASLGMGYKTVLRENLWYSLRRLTVDLKWITIVKQILTHAATRFRRNYDH